MKRFLPVLGLIGLFAGSGSAQVPVLIPVSIEAETPGEPNEEADSEEAIAAIASDGQNRAWAIFRRQGARLAVFEKDRWTPVKLPDFPPTLQALRLIRLKDGAIYCLWRDMATEKDHVLSRHTPDQHRLVVQVPVKLTEPRLLPLEDGGLLVTESGHNMLRVGKDGANPKILILPEDAFLPPKKNDDGSIPTDYLPVHAVQDKRGTIWLWSYAMKPMEWKWRLQGLSRFTDEDFASQILPGTKPDQPISVVTPWLGNRLAVALAGVGLFDIDVAQHSMRIFDGVDDELKYIERIFSAHDDWHLITTPRPSDLEVSMSTTFNSQLVLQTDRFYNPQKRSSALFRLHGTEMLPLTWKLDEEPAFGWPERPVIETKNGFWTCAKGGGLVWVPTAADLPLQTLDWRNGLTLREPNGFAQSGRTEFIVLDRATGKTCLMPLEPAVEPKATSLRVEVLMTESLLLEDGKGRIWGRMADRSMQRWENGRWTTVEVPAEVKGMGGHVFVADEHGQGWLIPIGEGSAAVCDFATGEWFTFATIETALVARMKPASRLRLRDFPSLVPISAAGDPLRIGFLRQSGTLHYFDGKEWQNWKLADIAGPDARITSVPAFDSDGRFALAIGASNWRLMPGGKWESAGHKADEAERVYHSEEVRPPPDCPVKNIISTAYDRHGVCWLSDAQRRLWKSLPGCAVPVLQANEPNPLPQGAIIYEAHTDNTGNAFLRLQSGWDGGKYLAVRSRLPLPVTAATPQEVVADTARVEFGESAWHRWRIDAGEWAHATEEREHTFTGLPPGSHVIEIMAFSGDLTPASTSVKLSIVIQAAEVTELTSQIRQFGGDDLDANEVAARRLRSQGRAILPYIKKSREQADERTRWWLDAVIQQLEAKRDSQ
jgi:hypothetical protein